MSTSKHIDKICVTAVAITLVLTILFMNGANLGISFSGHMTGYEDRLFDTTTVHKLDIVMDDWDTFIENCENEQYSPCAVVIDGESYKNVGIRAKGNTSLSSVRSMNSQRYSFKLEFDQYESGKSYHGLDKLCLNNLIQDNTMMKDYLVYQMMADFGVDSPLCSFVYITVNGEDWGLYLAVEGVEESFLQRNYGTDNTELYKPDSTGFGGGRGNGKDFHMEDLNLEDFESGDFEPGDFDFQAHDSGNHGPSEDVLEFMASQTPPKEGDAQKSMPPDGGIHPGGGFDKGMGSDDVKLKYTDDDPDSYPNIFDHAKTDVSGADQDRLIAALKNLNEYTNLEDTLDMDEVLRYFVVHNFVCNGDSYTGTIVHNYYLYENDGRLGMIPWDYNLAFGTFQGNRAADAVNESIDNPISSGDVDDRPMFGWILSDETYTEEYHRLFQEFNERWFQNGELEQMILDTAELIRPYVERDPTKFCTADEFDAGVSALSMFVTLRSEAVTRQLNGDTSAVDTGELNLSDMGTMENMGHDTKDGKRPSHKRD